MDTEKLREEAIKLGAYCPIIQHWDNPSPDELARKYIEGIDFCIRNNFPSNEYLKHNFDGVMQRHGIFVDEYISATNIRHLVANGSCWGKVEYDGFSYGKIYVRERSELTVFIKGNAIAHIEMFDKVKVHVVNTGSAEVIVYRYGGKLKTSGNVIVKNKMAI